MKCEMDYCIYNENFNCILDETQTNSLGMCDLCEIVTIPEENLKEYKRKRLEEIQRIWTEYDGR